MQHPQLTHNRYQGRKPRPALAMLEFNHGKSRYSTQISKFCLLQTLPNTCMANSFANLCKNRNIGLMFVYLHVA